VRLGSLDVTPLSDGFFTATPHYFGPEASFEGHDLPLEEDGSLRLPIGTFVVRGLPGDRSVLIDAGLGAGIKNAMFEGGRLLDGMTGAGISPDSIDAVVCSHLHIDHCGWIVNEADRAPVFPNATVWAGAADWRSFVDEGQGVMLDHVREGLRLLADAGRVELVDGDHSIAPGISTMAAPGHTPGHVAIVLSSGDERALLLGDAISCPIQLEETDWSAMSDVDPDLARRTRERLWQELEGEDIRGAGAHFPGLEFGRVLRGQGRRYWA